MFFELSKILWFLVNPGNLFFVLLILAGLLLWTPWVRAGRVVVSFLVVAGLGVAVVPVGKWVIWHLENRFPVTQTLPDRIDGIVVAGGIVNPGLSKARGQPVVGGGVERLTATSHLAGLFPDAEVIFSGGSGDLLRPDLKEADYVAPFFQQMGIAPERVVFENRARNTVENAEITFKIADPQPGETWILITSAFHMPRAIGSFRKAGWNILAYPTDFSTGPELELRYGFDFIGGLRGLSRAVHEILGLVFYRLTGKTGTFFPAPRKT